MGVMNNAKTIAIKYDHGEARNSFRIFLRSKIAVSRFSDANAPATSEGKVAECKAEYCNETQ